MILWVAPRYGWLPGIFPILFVRLRSRFPLSHGVAIWLQRNSARHFNHILEGHPDTCIRMATPGQITASRRFEWQERTCYRFGAQSRVICHCLFCCIYYMLRDAYKSNAVLCSTVLTLSEICYSLRTLGNLLVLSWNIGATRNLLHSPKVGQLISTVLKYRGDPKSLTVFRHWATYWYCLEI